MKFDMDIIPLKATVNSTFQFPTIGNTDMANTRICKVGATLPPLKTQGHTIMYGNKSSKNT
jgi:hypothetical protein